jgi:hypothetical protein
MGFSEASDLDIIAVQGGIESIDVKQFIDLVRAIGSEPSGAKETEAQFRDAVHEASHALFLKTMSFKDSKFESFLEMPWKREGIHSGLKKVFPKTRGLPAILDEEVLTRRVEALFMQTLGFKYDADHWCFITCMEFHKSFGAMPGYDGIHTALQSRPSMGVLARCQAIIDWYNSRRESK